MAFYYDYEDDDDEELVCEECGAKITPDERCIEHGYECICKDCCPECRDEYAYWDEVNRKIDEGLGK